MATVNVNLYVDTVNVTESNIDTTCTFNQASGTDEEYTTVVTVGDTVIWAGFPSDDPSTSQVNINSIVDTGGSNVFTNLVTSSTPPKTVTGTVEASLSGPTEDDETYTLNFSVLHMDGTETFFSIDPKIQVHPPPPLPMESNLEPKEEKLVSE